MLQCGEKCKSVFSALVAGTCFVCLAQKISSCSCSQLYKQHAFLRTLAPNYSSLCMYSVFSPAYFSTSMKLLYHLPLWFNPHFQYSQSFLHLSLAEIQVNHHLRFISLYSSFFFRRRCSWGKWGKRDNRNWQWIFHDETRSTGNELIFLCFSLLQFLISSTEWFFVGWSDNAVMAMTF